MEKAKEFVPIEMLEAIPDPEQTTTEADIEFQLQEALVSIIAAINPKAVDSNIDLALQADYIASQADFILIIRLNSWDIMERNYLDVDDDADTRLF